MKFRIKPRALCVRGFFLPCIGSCLWGEWKLDAKVSIIVITGYPSVASAIECMTEGADHYLVKPIKMDDLDVKIKKALEKRAMQ